MANEAWKKGFSDAKRGDDPSLPTDHKRYDWQNLVLDTVFCPGLGTALALGESKATAADDEEYKQGYLAGSIARK
jgi:hypothetical protein